MPLLDVSEVFFDPNLVDVFNVTRRTETVDEATGRSSTTPDLFENITGVVLVTDPKDNVRRDDSQMTSRVITVTTQFRLRAASDGVQPDIIHWMGSDFTVKAIKPHTRYGAGFVSAVAESMNAFDPPPV